MNDQLSSELAALRIVRDERPPPRRGWWRWVVALALLGGAVFAVRAWAIPYANAKLFKAEVTVTEVSMVSPAQASIDLTATGYVVPQVVAKIGAKVTGRVAKVNVREGGAVKAGDVLFVIDDADQKSAVASAQARQAAVRARASAAYARAQVTRATLAETKQQYEREKTLAASGAATSASADDLGARMRSLQEQVHAADSEAAAADAEASAAQAEVKALQVNLDSFTIVAPIDGTAVVKPAQVGDVVTPIITLVELVDFASLQIEADVPEARLGQVKKGGPCEVVFDAFPDKRLRGEVVEVSPRLNRAKATGTVKVALTDKLDGVLPEMSARVSFLAKALDEAALKEKPKKIIPASAVVDRDGQKVAFVIDKGTARQVSLSLGPSFGSGFELQSDLAPGTQLVDKPEATLVDGQPVKEKGGEQ